MDTKHAKQRPPPYYANEIDEAVFYFQQYGKAVYIPKQTCKEGRLTDLITFNDEEHKEELHTISNLIVELYRI